MNTFASALAALSLLLVVSACGSENAEDSAGPQPDPTASVESTEPAAPASETVVASVALRRTGGLVPDTVNRVYSADAEPPKGHTAAEVAAALAAAEAFAASGAEVTPMPKNTCCDRYTYAVTITLVDGTSETYTSLDGLDQPKPFNDLLSSLG